VRASWWAVAAAIGGGAWWLGAARRRMEPTRCAPDPECVEVTSEDSFPASDPPAWTGASASAEN
jgi:hypothetical protein